MPDPNDPNTLELPDSDVEAAAQEAAEVEERVQENGVVPPELLESIKKQVTAQIIDEMKEQKVFEEKQRELEREEEDMERKRYIDKMKASSDPWVDFVGNVRDTEHGQRIELEWNDAFIDYLKANGINGTTQEQIVQKYITLLFKDMTEKYEDEFGNDMV